MPFLGQNKSMNISQSQASECINSFNSFNLSVDVLFFIIHVGFLCVFLCKLEYAYKYKLSILIWNMT